MKQRTQAQRRSARLLTRQLAAGVAGAILLGLLASCPCALAAAGEPEAGSTPRGYPLALSADLAGGVWFGGATEGSGRPESVDRIDYITPAGTFLDFPFPAELDGYWPEAFAPGPNGEEWFLARSQAEPVPVLGEISRSGQLTVQRLAVPAGSDIRGLALGSDGNLWMADTRIERLTRISAILKVTPSGSVTAYSAGLQRGAIPDSITAGPEGALWFTDTVGRIGRIDTAGSIKEFPVGHSIEPSGTYGPPPPIVAGPDGAVWFVLNPRQLGRMTPSGHVQIFTPPPSQVQTPSGRGSEEEAIEGLASGPDREMWFTRSSGVVARISSTGRVNTVTDRLVSAKGIALASNGSLWVGEEASFQTESGPREIIPTRIARISASGALTQYPEPPSCKVPSVLGDGPAHAAEELRNSNCELAGIHRPRHSRSNHLIVVAQSVRAGAVEGYKAPVRLVLGPRPPTPLTCRTPRYVHVIADTPQLIAWIAPISEADSSNANGEGPQPDIACVPGHHAKYAFFTEERNSEYYAALDSLHTASHFIAFTDSTEDHYNNGDEELVVFDAWNGRQTFTEAYGFSEGSNGATISSFVLNAEGDVAWIKQEVHYATVEGHVLRTGQLETLEIHNDTGTSTVEAQSSISGLVLHGQTLTWKSDGQERSRILP